MNVNSPMPNPTTPDAAAAKQAAPTLCPNCGHDQDGQQPTHCLSCAWPLTGNRTQYSVGQLVTVTDQNGDEFDAEVLENMLGGYFRLEVEVAESAAHQFWTAHESRMTIPKEESK